MESKAPTPRRSRPLVATGLVLISALLVPAGIEGAARAWVLIRHGGDWDVYNLWNTIYEAHPHSWYRPRPEGEFRISGGYRVELDSHGFRSPEPAAVKSPGVSRIAFLGGSTTFNSESPSNDATVALQTMRMIREARPELAIEVLNAATPGYTTMESLTTLVSRVLPLEPDLIVVYHGVNDAAFRIRGEFRPDYWHPPKPLHTRFDSWLYRWSLFYRWVTYRGVSGSSPPRPSLDELKANARAHRPDGFERNLRSMIAVARAHGAEVVLSSFAYCPDPGLPDREEWEVVFEGIDEQNGVVRRLAAEVGAPLLDVAARFPRDCGLFTNQVHRTEEGLRAHARMLADFVLQSGLLEQEALTGRRSRTAREP